MTTVERDLATLRADYLRASQNVADTLMMVLLDPFNPALRYFLGVFEEHLSTDAAALRLYGIEPDPAWVIETSAPNARCWKC